jgi:hypothetical protein
MIEHDAAVELKDAANALAESEQHLRSAGDFSEGVVEAAAADYLDKKAKFDDAVDKVQAQEDEGDPTPVEDGGTPGPTDDEEREDLAGDPAASVTGLDAGANDHGDEESGDGSHRKSEDEIAAGDPGDKKGQDTSSKKPAKTADKGK